MSKSKTTYKTVFGMVRQFGKNKPAVEDGTMEMRNETVRAARFTIRDYKREKLVRVTLVGEALDAHRAALDAGALIFADGAYSRQRKKRVREGEDEFFHSLLVTNPTDIWVGVPGGVEVIDIDQAEGPADDFDAPEGEVDDF